MIGANSDIGEIMNTLTISAQSKKLPHYEFNSVAEKVLEEYYAKRNR